MSDTVDSDFFEPFSVLNLDYKLESDLHGDVKAGATQRIALRPVVDGSRTGPGTDQGEAGRLVRRRRHLAEGDPGQGAPATGRVRSGRPRSRGFLAVRSSAGTDSGFSVKNEIIRAYGLR